ncbi:unnamed protein product [Lymnaea stagnalis]|uniref:Uncharacterized protein n=1 Tax=Lymnaea stagnalis TaxID=6523 RepID=A0AAV2HB52_LYMST
MSRDRYPVLLGGFALTGCGIIVSLLGTILKVMGPVSSWAGSFSSVVPSRRRCPETHMVVYSGGSEPCSADSCETHPGSRSFGAGKHRGRGDRVQSVILCCHRKSRYNSVPSSRDSTSDVNYRHYEEISFDDMPPPPPLELLRPISGDYSLAMCSSPHAGDDTGSQILRNAIVRNAAHYPRATLHQHSKPHPGAVEQMRSNDHQYLNQNQYLPPPPPPPLPFTEPTPQSKPVPKARRQNPKPSGSRTKKRAPSPRHREPSEKDIKTRTLNHYTLSGAGTQQQRETPSSRYKTLPYRTSCGQARDGSGQTGNARCISGARTGSYHGKNIGHHV